MTALNKVPSEMEWYSLRVISGKEKKARETILYETEEANLQEQIGEILVPSENVVEMKEGKKRVRNKVFFPGYILIHLHLTKEIRYLIENTPGIISFVGPKGEPVPLREDEVSRILGEVQGKEGREVLAHKYRVGDPIKVVDGPFIDFTGFVEEVNDDKQKVKVTVSIFGRPTPVELDFLQVEPEK
jgi:transcriptional antiterminator NusG